MEASYQFFVRLKSSAHMHWQGAQVRIAAVAGTGPPGVAVVCGVLADDNESRLRSQVI